MLAGMISDGDVDPISEYNFHMDPYLADAVFKTGVNITLLPIEAGTCTTGATIYETEEHHYGSFSPNSYVVTRMDGVGFKDYLKKLILNNKTPL